MEIFILDTKLRRTFLKSAAIGTAASYLAAPAIVRGRNLNEKLRIAVIGMGGRASSHATSLIELEKDSSLGIELAGICDCDEPKLGTAVTEWGKRAGHSMLAITTYEVFLTISRSMP